MDQKFIFISYSHKNSQIVFSIVRRLQADGFSCWMDQRIDPGNDWRVKLAERIRNCDCFIVFGSKSYFLSSRCSEEWKFARLCEKNILRIQLDDYPIPDDAIMALSPYQYIDYDGSEDFWRVLERSEKIAGSRRNSNDPDTKDIISDKNNQTIDFNREICSLAQWLMDIRVKWGLLDTSKERQYANTCEGLLAMKMSGYDRIKKQRFISTWNELCQAATEKGLSSKSLGKETVVCTSLLLMLAAMEHDALLDADITRFEQMARNLWEIRNPEYGWGIYVSPMDDDYCSYANTAWALIALHEYASIRDSEAYQAYCHQIFEAEKDGAFPFYRNGKPKLITSAMYLSLYYRMSPEWRKEQSSYDYKKAIDFVYHTFVDKNVQIEVETIYGVNSNGIGPQKVPWNHITVWFALDALSRAFFHGHLEEERWVDLLRHMKHVIRENVRVAGKLVCYHPDLMDESREGQFTFPTAYLIMGLSQLVKV